MAKTARRRRWLWLGVLPALALLALLGLRAMLQPERLSAFLLKQASQATGLQLALSQPADVGFWPDLHLELAGLVATAPGADAPLLRVERVEAVLPWSALRSEALEIRSLRLVQPELDWAATRDWLATRAKSSAPMALPHFDAAVEVTEGRIVAQDWTLADLSLRLPALRADAATTLDVAGKLRRAADAVPFAGRLAFTPRQLRDGVRLDALVLISTAPHAATLRGAAEFADDVSLQLAGELTWPPGWPALPLPADDPASPLRIDFDYRAGSLQATLARGDAGLDIELAPGDLAAWRADPAAPLLPPFTGSARAERLQFGGVELRGVELRVDDDDAAR